MAGNSIRAYAMESGRAIFSHDRWAYNAKHERFMRGCFINVYEPKALEEGEGLSPSEGIWYGTVNPTKAAARSQISPHSKKRIYQINIYWK